MVCCDLRPLVCNRSFIIVMLLLGDLDPISGDSS